MLSCDNMHSRGIAITTPVPFCRRGQKIANRVREMSTSRTEDKETHNKMLGNNFSKKIENLFYKENILAISDHLLRFAGSLSVPFFPQHLVVGLLFFRRRQYSSLWQDSLTPSGRRNRCCCCCYYPPIYTGRPKYIKHSGNTHKLKKLHLNRLLGVAKH